MKRTGRAAKTVVGSMGLLAPSHEVVEIEPTA